MMSSPCSGFRAPIEADQRNYPRPSSTHGITTVIKAAANKLTSWRWVVALTLAGAAPSVSGQIVLDSFNPSIAPDIRALVVQPDGKILVGGDFSFVTPAGGVRIARRNIARLNSDGTLDPDFNPNADGQVRALAVQADGKVLAGGSFLTIGGKSRNYVARLDAITGSADSFDPSPNVGTGVDAIAVQPDGKILIGGSFNGLTPNGGPGFFRQRIARLNENGSLDPAFGLDVGADNAVHAILVQADGSILVGGLFTMINGEPRNRIARLHAVGGLPQAFDPGALGGSLGFSVSGLAVQADGKVLAVGSFTSVGGQTRKGIARFDGTTGALDSFDPKANSTLSAIAVQADGKILVGGSFSGANSIGGAARNRLARLDPVTALADSFDPNANNVVSSIVPQADGRILVGGSFQFMSGKARNSIARFGPPELPLLDIQRGPPANVVLSWATNFGDYALEASADPTATANAWSAVGPAPAASGIKYVVTNAASGSALFYRLRK